MTSMIKEGWKALVEIVRDDPLDAAGGVLAWGGLIFMAMMGFVIF